MLSRLKSELIKISLSLIACSAVATVAAEKPRSVYEISPVRDFSLTGLGLLGTAVPYLFEGQWIRRRCPCSPNEVNGLDRGAIGNRSDGALVYTDVIAVLAMAGPPLLDYLDVGWTDVFFEDMMVYAQTLATSAALVSITKTIIQRPLPRSYSGDPAYMNNPTGYRSFYSGHVAMTVTALSAAAFTLNLRHKTGPWPWIVVGTLGASVAVGRVLGGVHFPTDVLVGAAMGVGVGTLLPLLHTRKQDESSLVFLSPLDHGAQLMFTKRL